LNVHAGLSYFIIDMKQPGVNVQPLQQMNGHATFNQVFMTDAVVPPDLILGAVGEGWAVTTTTLMHERRGADALRGWAMGSDAPGRIYAEERKEITVDLAPYKWYPQRAGRVDLLLPRARETGAINDPVTRQELAKLLIMAKAAEWTARRARAAQEQGRPQGPEGSLGKLASSHVARAAARIHTQMTGANALLTGADGVMDGLIAEILVSVPATSIAGGTDEIQRNIIAERVLKMPREASVDTGKPFRDVPRNTVS
jgi:alkylation response protein AidB-like acyl-CoA dehydrogenase